MAKISTLIQQYHAMKYLWNMTCATLIMVALTLLLGCGHARAQTAPSWLLPGKHATAYDLDISAAGVLSMVGSGAFGREPIRLGNTTLTGHDSTSVLVAAYADDEAFMWGRQGAFRVNRGGFILGRDLVGFHGAIDGMGNVYTSEGYPWGPDAGMFTGGGVSINKYAPDGRPRWSVPVHPPVADFGDQPGFVVGLGVDQAGNAYVGGLYRDTLILTPDTLVAFSSEVVGDVFLASYTPEGDLRWSQRLGGPRVDLIAAWGDPHGAFTVDADGNTYLGGVFSAGAVFGEGQPTEVTLPRDAYALASYDAQGILRWVRTASDLGISDNAGPCRMAVDDTGHLAVDWFVLSTGGVNTVTIGDTTFTDPGFGGEFLTRLSPEGQVLWARQLKSDGNEIISDVATDAQGHVYVSGYFDGLTLELEDETLRKQDLQADKQDGFVAHYDAEGHLRWAGHAAGENFQRINAITASPSGDLYVAGEFEELVHLGPETLTAQMPNGIGMFVAKYDAATITAGEEPVALPAQATLAAAYPNPFRGQTTIRYTLAQGGPVRLVVYDVLGREVAVLVDEVQPAGTHEVIFEAAGVASGVYVARLETGDGVQTQTLTRVR